MSKNKSPREWTIQRFEDAYNYYENVEGPNTGENAHGIESVKVIERAAYDKLAAENAQLKDERERWRLADFEKLIKERDQARAECERLKSVLAAQGLPSDLQEIVVERDRYKAEVERLRADDKWHDVCIEERDRYRAALERIVNWGTCQGTAGHELQKIARKALEKKNEKLD